MYVEVEFTLHEELAVITEVDYGFNSDRFETGMALTCKLVSGMCVEVYLDAETAIKAIIEAKTISLFHLKEKCVVLNEDGTFNRFFVV